MKTIKEYSNTEMQELVDKHNRIVKTAYQTNERGIEWMISQADTDAIEPYYELPSNETKSGAAVIFEFEFE